LVGIGKPRTAYIIPTACRHYQPLPAATTKPKQPNKLDSIAEPVADIIDTVDTQSGGPEGRYTTHTAGMAYCSKPRAPPNHHARWGPVILTPTTSIKAYDPILHIEGNNFGKEFLRMAGIVQMLHLRKQPNDNYPYAHGIRIRSIQSEDRHTRDQAGPCTQIPPAVPGSVAHVSHLYKGASHSRLLTCSIWPILHILLTLSTPSIRAYRLDSIEDSINSRA
jgi:hypothetical protein